MTPRVSVLMPCFNQGAFIHEAIESVLAQTVLDAEIVVVDDGSTDADTVARLDALQTPRTTVLRTPNRGLPAARNLAAKHARGDVFCALDADDRLAPVWFERALTILDGRPELAVVSHWLQAFGDESWTWTPGSCELPALLARNTVNGAALVRRAAFEAVGGYDETMRDGCEDWDFWLRLVERGFQGAIVPEVMFHYRRNASSMSRVMISGDDYRRVLEQLVSRHEAAYRAHLVDVIVAGARETEHLQAETAAMDQARCVTVEPALARAEEDLRAVAAKAARAEVDVQREQALARLEWEAAELRREVQALRRSWSWRVMAPLRFMYRAAWTGRVPRT